MSCQPSPPGLSEYGAGGCWQKAMLRELVLAIGIPVALLLLAVLALEH